MNDMSQGQLELLDSSVAQSSRLATGLCAGANVLTLEGEIPVEFLVPGDRVITRDRGAQILRAVKSCLVDAQNTIRINAHALDESRPDKEVVVAEGQPILLRQWLAKALFGQSSAMTPAKALIDGKGIAPTRKAEKQKLYQLSFDNQHVIYADGLELASAPVKRA